MSGSSAAGLGIGAEAWLFLTLLMCLTLFFKFGRIWSVRNLDLLLIFALVPGMITLVGAGAGGAWWAYLWLFIGSSLWLVRCLLDLGLTRRPFLEPNLNAAGLSCLVVGIVGLFAVEVVNLPMGDGARRNPADSPTSQPVEPVPGERIVDEVIRQTPLTAMMHPDEKPRELLRRVLALLAQVTLVIGLATIGWRHFDRPTTGLSMAACYLLLPYPRLSLVDNAQLVPSALVVVAVACHLRPRLAGMLIGASAGWIPACLGLIPLWAGFYRGRGFWRFALPAAAMAVLVPSLRAVAPGFDSWLQTLGVPTASAAGIWPGADVATERSFWAGIDANYRLPVQIAYLLLVVIVTLLPRSKNLGELIALSAALLVASQFWYPEAGGTLILLYLPLVILMMFRPNLASKPAPFRSGRVAI